ncbi:MAG: alpha/beta fold hydrolase [Actinomycetota bacterium]|nr:alpha/beta fold hydrolase [Actinomycetota bacterium]
MPYARCDSRQLFYERRGSGEPLLLIQGMAGHHELWGDRFMTALARAFDIVAFDHRGIGTSTDVPGPFSIVDLAEDAVSVMDELGWSTAHVMGISMGGMVAQEVALNHPGRVRRLVLGCTYAGDDRVQHGVNVATLIPGARLHTFDDVGHLFWWERAAETSELVVQQCLTEMEASR